VGPVLLLVLELLLDEDEDLVEVVMVVAVELGEEDEVFEADVTVLDEEDEALVEVGAADEERDDDDVETALLEDEETTLLEEDETMLLEDEVEITLLEDEELALLEVEVETTLLEDETAFPERTPDRTLLPALEGEPS
jgi:hypothetical protein